MNRVFTISAAMLLAISGCGDTEPTATVDEPLGRPEQPPIVVEDLQDEPAGEDDLERGRVEIESALRELDVLDRRHAELAETASASAEVRAVALPLLEDIGRTIAATRADALAMASGDPAPGGPDLRTRVATLRTMLDDAAAIIEESRTTPVALPDLPTGPSLPKPKAPK